MRRVTLIASELKRLMYSPFWVAKLLHHFLSGVTSEDERGIKIELIYFVIPFIFDTNIRNKLVKANKNSTMATLFNALLHLSCKENKSVIPSFLFLDQPSQVYFPKEYKQTEDDVDENIEQVKNIFKVIKDELEIIKKDCDFMPQVVIMDHADEKEFNTYVKKRWSKDGDKLI